MDNVGASGKSVTVLTGEPTIKRQCLSPAVLESRQDDYNEEDEIRKMSTPRPLVPLHSQRMELSRPMTLLRAKPPNLPRYRSARAGEVQALQCVCRDAFCQKRLGRS